MQEEKRIEPTEAIEKRETVNNIKDNDDKSLLIKKGRVDSISIYEVTEDEVTILENGYPFSTYLNFSLFFAGVFFSCLLTFKFYNIYFKVDNFTYTLLRLDFNEKIICQNIAIIITAAVSFIISVITLIMWLQNKKNSYFVIKKIRDRIQ